jgi:hypothetical protein
MTFDNARAECKKLKMDLVISQTVEENMCVQRQIAEQGGEKTYFGIINFLVSLTWQVWRKSSFGWV